MIKIENVEIMGWEPAIRGMRNPMNSWDKSDSYFCPEGSENCSVCECNHTKKCIDGFLLGKNDYQLMLKLAKGGSVHAKYRRMINVYCDITAPLYWWKNFDTYKVGTVANSCSTMHKIHERELTMDDFSHEHLDQPSIDILKNTIAWLNVNRGNFVRKPHRKDYWWQMIQLLPTSYNQKRTVQLNYEVLSNIYIHRKDHKLDEWREFCNWIELLPYSKIITLKEEE